MVTIITSGHTFLDMDSFACIFAYQELLSLQGEEVIAFSSGVANASVPKKYKEKCKYKNDIEVVNNIKEKSFVLVDISDYNHFDSCVELNQVSKIFDHHPGFESFWQEKLGSNAIIEPIGAAATLIFREFKKNNLLDKISPLSAELLSVAILSNSLNFQAKITKDEDKEVYEELKKYFNFTENFESDYFESVQQNIENDLENSLKNDSKIIENKLFIAQLEIWNANNLLKNKLEKIKEFLDKKEQELCFLNLIELGEKRNTMLFKNKKTLEYIKRFFPEFDYDLENNIAVTPHVMLHKEILTRIFEKNNNKV